MTSARKSWSRTAGALELAYTVFAYDQRGHGDAASVHGPMTFERIVQDCVQVADTIPGGVDTIIGHSWGGSTAILAGLKLGVSRIVSIDPLFHVRRLDWRKYWHDEMDPILNLQGAERERKIIEEYRDLPEVDVQAKIHALRDMTIDPLIDIGLQNGSDEGKLDLRETIVNYPKPLLMMLADEKESVVHPKDVAFIREHGGRNVTIKVFPGEGHSLHRTAFDEYMRVLNAFISAVIPSVGRAAPVVEGAP
jgi:pimeloyl-ACP methyl ester carboxylesterase